ncbi:Flagellar hook-basal body complex protein FliE [Candidatus Methanoperedenaceae archaeon GB50]|nr:Flagellar hook-basal body complex protein FliE [Candidatus Methanoperedenaceae archaeon GB50]
MENVKPLNGIPDIIHKGMKRAEPKKTDFSQMLKNTIEEINTLQVKADKAIEALATGESKNIHQTMIAIEKADISFKMMMQVRNKLLEAYKEIMHMQF